MKYFRINYRKIVGLSLWVLVVLTAPSVFAQSQPSGSANDEGLSSYLFTPRAVTLILVLILIAQLVYRHRVRSASATAPIMYNQPATSPQPGQATKKRYDRDEISKLLKASATTKHTGRSLEEAIRLSQAVQENLLGSIHAHVDTGEGVAPESDADPHRVEFEPHPVEAEHESVAGEFKQETER